MASDTGDLESVRLTSAGTLRRVPVTPCEIRSWHQMATTVRKLIGGAPFLTTNVTFGGIPAKFTIESDARLRIVIPTNALTGPVTVYTDAEHCPNAAALWRDPWFADRDDHKPDADERGGQRASYSKR